MGLMGLNAIDWISKAAFGVVISHYNLYALYAPREIEIYLPHIMSEVTD